MHYNFEIKLISNHVIAQKVKGSFKLALKKKAECFMKFIQRALFSILGYCCTLPYRLASNFKQVLANNVISTLQ